MREFAEVLRGLRRKRGLTQQQLGEMTDGVSASYVALLETSQRVPSREAVAALAAALRCRAPERKALFDAREKDYERERRRPPRVARAPAGQTPENKASDLVASAHELEQLIDRVRLHTEELGDRWEGAAGAALREGVARWETIASEAAATLGKIADVVRVYSENYKDLDRALATELRKV